MTTQQCHAIITLQCVRCAVLWFYFRFSCVHTYIVFSNHDTFFHLLLLPQYSWQFYFLFILVQLHRHNNFPPDGLLTWLLPRLVFFKCTFNSIRFAWINKIKPHREIDFVATWNNNNNNANWLFPYASACYWWWFASNSPSSYLMIYNWFANSMEKYHEPWATQTVWTESVWWLYGIFNSFLSTGHIIRNKRKTCLLISNIHFLTIKHHTYYSH